MPHHRPLLLLAAALCLLATPAGLRGQPASPDRFPQPAPLHEPPAEHEPLRPPGHTAIAPQPAPRRITHSQRPAAGSEDASSRTPATGSLWSTLGALSLVLILILGAARIWRRHAPRAVGILPSEALEILGHRALGRRQAIHLVRLGPRLLVLGSSDEGLRTLAEITDPLEVDSLAGLCRGSDADGGFGQAFLTFFQRQTPAGVPASAGTKDPQPTAGIPASAGADLDSGTRFRREEAHV